MNQDGPPKMDPAPVGLDDLTPGRIHGLFAAPLALSSILDPLPVGIIVLDPDQRIIAFNRAVQALTAFTADEAWGVPVEDILRPHLGAQQPDPLVEAADSGQAAVREGDIINRDRRKVPIRLTVTPLKDAAGRPLGFLETVEDIRLFQRRQEGIDTAYGFGTIIGRSPKMEDFFRILPVIAQTDSSVLITGETGTGKDLAAEAIHQNSARAREPFIKINCGALPETLLESELFGHTKGAFTGAVHDKPGRLRLAHKGTLYLTEIGDLPLALQVKLLTFLDDQVVYPLGSTKGFQADVRVIAATHRNLEQMVRKGLFREDLLFRLNVVRLHLPPLREREGDVPLLMDHFLALFANRFGKKIQRFSSEARRLLLRYSFPGNARELKNIVEYSVNVCQEESIKPDHLPAYLTDLPDAGPLRPVSDNRSQSAPVAEPESRPIERRNWSEIERQMIVDALIQAKGRKSRASEILGWGRSTLWRKMKEYGLE